jgi:hypothetical protein
MRDAIPGSQHTGEFIGTRFAHRAPVIINIAELLSECDPDILSDNGGKINRCCDNALSKVFFLIPNSTHISDLVFPS